jgi:hypothetical protein
MAGQNRRRIADLFAHGDRENAIPPRIGNYISYRLVRDFMKEHHDKDLTHTLRRPHLVRSWNHYLADRLDLPSR